ncbi:nuclear transport factor 2 family protein [Larkinella humicola]|uniref:Nuclear transport factor 2 family protein n=1 Tax=Larkinella humicola TaxID=2607654 RepID=A0A5N1JI78_9BACT|nr:nuclear transport factor 2 family protein [Larkinella humicola]KAA9354068.1 nuclear transport factor 2 family protein [Larkinella humicola]
MKLPGTIEGLIKAQNDLDSMAFAAYFTEEATVSDEGSAYSGRTEIKQWIQQATQKYQMQLQPLDYNQTGTVADLTVEVTGTFDGSPAVMHYHLDLAGQFIRSLRITG